jgi:hypothetical protein
MLWEEKNGALPKASHVQVLEMPQETSSLPKKIRQKSND